MLKKLSVKYMVYSALFAILTSVLSYATIPQPFSLIPLDGKMIRYA